MKLRDKIICIHPDKSKLDTGKWVMVGSDLEMNGVYTLDFIYNGQTITEVMLAEKPGVRYSMDRFITLNECRKRKINTLITNIKKI